MLACSAEREKNRPKANPTWIYRRSPDVINDIRPSSPSDRLHLEYDGNQLVHVTDSVTSGHNYAGAFHFADGADETRQGLGDGVTVTLQVLVLSFPVRIRVTQHTKSPSR